MSDIIERLLTIAPRIKRTLGIDTPTEAADEIEHLRSQLEDIPEGCTPADAQKLREFNHGLAAENERLRSRLAELEGRAAPAPAAELVVVGKHADYGYRASRENPWFGYDPEGDGMQFFATEAEAKSYAETAISASLDEFWSESVDQVCYGRVVGAAAQTNRVDRPETLNEDGCDEQGISWPDDCEFLCNYELAPVPAPPAVPEWQPIETAPRDGANILGFTPFGIEVVRWCKWNGEDYAPHDGWIGVEQDSTCQPPSFRRPNAQTQPTHWRPLPAAPQREGGE